MNKSITLFVAAYNKQDYIYGTLIKIYRAVKEAEIEYEIIIVNDCSEDKTYQEIVRFLNEYQDKNIVLINNNINMGLAKNFIKSIELSTKSYIRLINGDDAEDLNFHIKILKLIGEKDIIIPYYVKILGRSKIRVLLSIIFTKIINIISGNHLHYYNGAPIFKVSHLKSIYPLPLGMTYSAEILVRLLKQGRDYSQIPTVAENKGKSNAINIQNLMYALLGISRIIIGRLKG